MICYFYTTNPSLLFFALERFFKYILNIHLEMFTGQEITDIHTNILFVLEEDKDSPHFLSKVTDKNFQFVTLGYCKNSQVNLLDLSRLKEQLEDAIFFSPVFSPLSAKESNQIAKRIFHSHGKESLLALLNATRYHFVNGVKLVLLGEISRQESIESFLSVGLASWDDFVSQVDQQEIYLKILFNRDVWEMIEGLMSELNNFAEQMRDVVTLSANFISEENLNINIALLDKMDDIFSSKYADLVKNNGSL